MEEMGKEDRGESIVEICQWFVRHAERAMDQDIRAIGKVEKAGIKRSDFGTEYAVILQKFRASAGGGETGEEDVIGGL